MDYSLIDQFSFKILSAIENNSRPRVHSDISFDINLEIHTGIRNCIADVLMPIRENLWIEIYEERLA